jgi:hypothetical protein
MHRHIDEMGKVREETFRKWKGAFTSKKAAEHYHDMFSRFSEVVMQLRQQGLALAEIAARLEAHASLVEAGLVK